MIQIDTDVKVSPAVAADASGSQLVKLNGAHSLRTAATLRASLLQALAGQGPLAIDLTDIEEADVGTLQALIATERSATEAGRELRFVAAADSPMGKLLVATGVFTAGASEFTAGTAQWTFEKGIWA
jgi:anti-anti-sigma regulatory factor